MSEEAPDNLQRKVKEFKLTLVETFNEHFDSAMYALEF